MTWCNAVNLIVKFISLLTMQSYSDIFSQILIIVFYSQELIPKSNGVIIGYRN